MYRSFILVLRVETALRKPAHTRKLVVTTTRAYGEPGPDTRTRDSQRTTCVGTPVVCWWGGDVEACIPQR